MVAQTISLSIMLVAILAGSLFSNKAVKELKADLKGDFKDLKGDLKDLKSDFGREIDRLEAKIDSVSAGLNGRLDVIEGDLRQFYHLSGKLEGRIDTIEKRVA